MGFLIVGGTSGMELAPGRLLAEEGASVVVTAGTLRRRRGLSNLWR